MNDNRKNALTDLRGWAEAELMPWRFFSSGNHNFDEAVRRSVDEDPSVFRFKIHDGIVTFYEKPPEQYLAQLGSFEVYRVLRDRGHMYQRFLQSVVWAFDIAGTTDMAIDLDDLADRDFDGPVFRFQKIQNSRAILLPDVDMLHWDFYLSNNSHDSTPFAEKQDTAIFVGSTSGLSVPIDRAVVDQLSLPRLRSAVYFKGNSDVRFELPGIVQCDGPETENRIRDLGIGDVARSWGEQLTYRYLISIDGNGATCSRVAIALKSNSILMRYHSINELYYFHGLQAWLHFVPIARDEDAPINLAFLRQNAELSLAIAKESQAFYRAYLSRIAVMTYMAELIYGYMALLEIQDRQLPERPVFAIDSFGHFKDRGDQWSAPNGWLDAGDGRWIEGIALIPGPEIAASDLSYRAIDVDGTELDAVEPWGLAGSRGQGRALCGFRIKLHGEATSLFELSYEARFLDGTQVGPLPGGTACVAASGSPLVGLRLIVHRR